METYRKPMRKAIINGFPVPPGQLVVSTTVVGLSAALVPGTKVSGRPLVPGTMYVLVEA